MLFLRWNGSPSDRLSKIMTTWVVSRRNGDGEFWIFYDSHEDNKEHIDETQIPEEYVVRDSGPLLVLHRRWTLLRCPRTLGYTIVCFISLVPLMGKYATLLLTREVAITSSLTRSSESLPWPWSTIPLLTSLPGWSKDPKYKSFIGPSFLFRLELHIGIRFTLT